MPHSVDNGNVEFKGKDQEINVSNETQAELVNTASPDRALTRSQRVASTIAQFRASLPKPLSRKRLSRREEDDILGFGPGGV